ncbi:MAG TPA: S1 RNA-binding domain-containing protein, partial [Candidatus Obscuribacterales bacterium]
GSKGLFWVLSRDNEETNPIVSYRKAKGWVELIEHKESGTPLNARVFCLAKAKYTGRVCGLRVVFESGALSGIRGFIPTRAVRHRGKMEALVGTEVPVCVVDVNPTGGGDFGTLVLSHLKADNFVSAQAFADMSAGQIVGGKVRKYIQTGSEKSAGILVDLENGVTGMLYEKEVTRVSGKRWSDVVPIGMVRDFEILRVEPEKQKVWLSIRNLDQNKLLHALSPGTVIEGEVVRSYAYGYFVHLGAGLNGLVHATMLRKFERGKHKELAIGQKVTVKVLSVAENGHRIALELVSFDPMA